MVGWGLAVLMTHLSARAVRLAGRDAGCLLETMPLASTQYVCAVLEVYCSQKRITGTKSEIDYALSSVDPFSVQALVFSHCEALSMPSRLQTFPNLAMIKIHNCSITEWGDDAALTAQAHPMMKIVYIMIANMSRIPQGLLFPDFPPTVYDIEFCSTDLTDLPLDLLEKWSMVMYFFLELSPGITEFPTALFPTTVTFSWRSLSVNSIRALPDDIFVSQNYEAFFASGNPLTKLQEKVGAVSAIAALTIAYTKIAEVPTSWLDASENHAQVAMTSRFALLAGSTPLCDKLLEARSQASVAAGSGSDSSSSLDEGLA